VSQPIKATSSAANEPLPGAQIEPEAPRRLLAAAIEAFGERGYHATTTREIAERAGMSPAGMYVHFQSKEDVLFQVTKLGHASALEAIEDALAGDAPPEMKVRRFVEAFTSWHARNNRAARVQQYELRALSRERYDEIRHVRGLFERLLKQQLREGIASRVFAITAVDTAALAILSLGIDVARWYRPGVDPAPEELGRGYAELVLGMLGYRGEATSPEPAGLERT
jgi:AcrR family transcriptional regulator